MEPFHNPPPPLNSPFVDFKVSEGCFFPLYLSQSAGHSLHLRAQIIVRDKESQTLQPVTN